MEINYEKRKNQELFKDFEKNDFLNVTNPQNYIPIYTSFFLLNENNYNGINLNNEWFISNINKKIDASHNIYESTIKNNKTKKQKNKNVFIKTAPLLDPYKYLIGKYNIEDENLFNLPLLPIIERSKNVNSKMLCPNNSSYIDGLFSYLSGELIDSYNFINGVEYYGSFLGVKKNYECNITDDIDYISQNPFFKKYINKLFTLDAKYMTNESYFKPLIKINHETNMIKSLSLKSINDELFEDVFDKSEFQSNHVFHELTEITSKNLIIHNKDIYMNTIRSGSSFSSRTTNTTDNENEGIETEEIENWNDIIENPDYDNSESKDYPEINTNNKEGETESTTELSENRSDDNTESTSDSDESDDSSEEEIFIDIHQFPVQLICMEKCDDTFDNLILNNELSEEEWLSSFMQIIMILIIFQKSFHFTHNDLHTNNIMFNKTNLKHITYLYKDTYYKVPTFGRLFKIIDFGRSIYKFKGKTFCSDSFDMNGDAAGQYNIEPYFNDKKPRLEPNSSFDLCRLACSIFDYLIDDINEIYNINNFPSFVKIVIEWCEDDNGVNLLYKKSGVDRYPDFKLYKMIARHTHKHTPDNQLEKQVFKNYIVKQINVKKDTLINIDKIPVFA
jgi:hypothetical protein